jgi:putative phage-type endonuclease
MIDLIEGVGQGSPGWHAARAGKVTASRIVDVMATIKTGEAASRREYKWQIVAEILTGKPAEGGFFNQAMQWGVEQEPFARAAYELRYETLVDQIGLVPHPRIARAAASPDGLVGEDGLIEIKCPKTVTHLTTLAEGKIPNEYQLQMCWQMACTGRDWVDFASFDPRLPEELQLCVIRFDRDEDRIACIEQEVERFLDEVDALIQTLRERAQT